MPLQRRLPARICASRHTHLRSSSLNIRAANEIAHSFAEWLIPWQSWILDNQDVMGRVSIALLLVLCLVPAPSGAQSNSLPSTAFGRNEVFRAGASTYPPAYDLVPRFSRQVVPGWYAVAGLSDVNDPSPVTSRYMSRGDIDPVPPYSRGRTPVVVPRSAYPDYLDRALNRISYRPTFVPVYYSVPVYPRYARWSFGSVAPVASSPAMYVIPGCYMGDAPPIRPEKLPPGCKLENLKRVWH